MEPPCRPVVEPLPVVLEVVRQPVPHKAWNAIWTAMVPSLARHSSFSCLL